MLIRPAAADDWPRIRPFRHRIVAAGETGSWVPETTEEAARAQRGRDRIGGTGAPTGVATAIRPCFAAPARGTRPP